MKIIKIFFCILVLLAAPIALWFGGIFVLYIIGCCFAGSIMLCYYLYNETLSMWHKIIRHRKAVVWALITLIGVGVLVYMTKYIYTQAPLFEKIKEQLTDDFIEVVTSVAIGTIISIMTIALPVIVSTMHNLADKYQTTHVLFVMNQDWTLVIFRILLLASLEASTAWIICFFHTPEKLYSIAILLFAFALLLTFSLIILVARMVYFSMPDKLFHIVEREIAKVSAPQEYFNPDVYNPFLYKFDSPQEKQRLKQLQKFDSFESSTTRLWIVVARIYALYGSDVELRKEILKFWENICRRASKIERDGIKRYTKDYYNFIYELADWAIEHNNVKLQEETITFMGLLLNAHLPQLAKFGEKETEEHRKKYFLSYDSFECLWKTMRKSVDSQSDDMFKKYWQIVNNFYSRKYMSIQSTNSEDESEKKNAEQEKFIFLVVHYLCCSYLMGRKKYNFIEYVLNYSQQSNFVWYLIPNNINDVLDTYFCVKEWYPNWAHKDYFSFTEDYNLFADVIISNPITQFTVLLLLIFEKDAEELKNISVDSKYQSYLKQLCDTLNYTDENTDWVKYLHIEDTIKHKSILSSKLESLLKINSTTVETCTFTKHTIQNSTVNEQSRKHILSFLNTIWSKIKNMIKMIIEANGGGIGYLSLSLMPIV